jgi:hypothetical protein
MRVGVGKENRTSLSQHGKTRSAVKRWAVLLVWRSGERLGIGRCSGGPAGANTSSRGGPYTRRAWLLEVRILPNPQRYPFRLALARTWKGDKFAYRPRRRGRHRMARSLGIVNRGELQQTQLALIRIIHGAIVRAKRKRGRQKQLASLTLRVTIAHPAPRPSGP